MKLCSNEGLNVQMCISTGNFDSVFFSRIYCYALFELRYLTKLKDTIETVGQHNSTETAQQNRVKLCSYEGHNVQICIFTGNADLILLRSNLNPLFCPIAIHCIQHSQAMLERGVCELAHSFFHIFLILDSLICIQNQNT